MYRRSRLFRDRDQRAYLQYSVVHFTKLLCFLEAAIGRYTPKVDPSIDQQV